MSQESNVTESAAYEETWREIDEVVQDIARLSRTDVTPERYFSELLEGATRTLAAVGGAVWLKRAESLTLEYQIDLARTGLVTAPDAEVAPNVEQLNLKHFQLLDKTLRAAENRAISPRSGAGSNGSTSSDNPTDLLLLLCPVSIDGTAVGLLEVFQRPDVSPAACQGALRFLTALANLAADFLKSSRFREMQERAALWGDFETFSESVHRGLDVRRIAGAIANDGRQVVGCDRLTVAVQHGSRPRIIAVSGLDSIDRRSNVMRAAEELIRRVQKSREALWYNDVDEAANGSDIALPPQLSESVHHFLDESPARLLAVVPLFAPRQEPEQPNSRIVDSPVGALLIERFEGTSITDLLKHRSDVVARQSASALANALQHSGLPFLGLLRLLGGLLNRLRLRELPKTVLITGTVAAAVTALFVVPAEFTIDGRGNLQPVVRRGIFAASNGSIAKLNSKLARKGTASVDAGEVLVELTNSDLEFELTRVRGEQRTARQSLATVKVERLTIDQSDPNWRSQVQHLAAREKELLTTIDSLQTQLDVLEKQQRELKLKSPIDGQILTWDPTQLLENRPVRRGDRLLEVANMAGEWLLKVRVPDQNIGYVKDARQALHQRIAELEARIQETEESGHEDSQASSKLRAELDELKLGLHVTFVVATDPDRTCTGYIREIASSTNTHPEDGPTVLVTVTVDGSQIEHAQLRLGATVIPHIHCGTRPIGFVWFHELIHAVRTRILF